MAEKSIIGKNLELQEAIRVTINPWQYERKDLLKAKRVLLKFGYRNLAIGLDVFLKEV